MKEYRVKYDEKTVGMVIASREGLYYSFQCDIDMPGLRLYVKTGKASYDLGICVPAESGRGFRVRKPVKLIQGDIEGFYLSGRGKNRIKHLIDPSAAFSDLQSIPTGRLCIEEGSYYLIADEA